MAEPQAYLLVYHSYPALSGDRWLDKSNDPELRVAPMTWGICRPNARRWLRPRADLFFLAYPDGGRRLPLEDRYHLSAHFRVGEVIDQDEAVRRFPGRPNVILDRLLGGPTLADGLCAYLMRHAAELEWPEREQIRRDLTTGASYVRSHAEDYLVNLAGVWYVHAYWDHHPDWRTHRIKAPYIVADVAGSKVLSEPIPYAACASACAALPRADVLQSQGAWKHPARRLTDDAAEYLLALLAPLSGRRRQLARVPQALAARGRC